MTAAQEKNHTDPIDLSSRTPLGQLMRRAVTYSQQVGADGSTAPRPSRKIFSLFLGPPSKVAAAATIECNVDRFRGKIPHAVNSNTFSTIRA